MSRPKIRSNQLKLGTVSVTTNGTGWDSAGIPYVLTPTTPREISSTYYPHLPDYVASSGAWLDTFAIKDNDGTTITVSGVVGVTTSLTVTKGWYNMTSCAFPDLEVVVGNVTAVAECSFPKLKRITGTLNIPRVFSGVPVLESVDTITVTGTTTDTVNLSFPELVALNSFTITSSASSFTLSLPKFKSTRRNYSTNGFYLHSTGLSVSLPATTTSFSLPELVDGAVTVIGSGLTTLSLAKLNGGSLTINSTVGFTSLSHTQLPAMTKGYVSCSGSNITTLSLGSFVGDQYSGIATGASTTSITLSALAQAAYLVFNGAAGLTSLSLNALTTVGGGGLAVNAGSVTTFSATSLTSVGGTLSLPSSLTSCSLGALATIKGGFSWTSKSGLIHPAITASYIGQLQWSAGNFADATGFTATNLVTVGQSLSLTASWSGFTGNAKFPELVTIGSPSNLGPSQRTSYTTGNYNALYLAGQYLLSSQLDFTKLATITRGRLEIACSATTISFPALVSVSADTPDTALSSAYTGIYVNSSTITGLTFTLLETVGNLAVAAVSASVGHGIVVQSASNSLTTLSFPALKYCYGYNGGLQVSATLSGLTTVSLPEIIEIGAPHSSGPTIVNMQATYSALTSFTIGATLKRCYGTQFLVRNAALTAASVENILVRLAALDGTNGTTTWGSGCTVNLSGGTSSGLAGRTANAITAYNTLVGRGATITLNA